MMNNQDTNFSIAVKTMPMCLNVQTKCEYVGDREEGSNPSLQVYSINKGWRKNNACHLGRSVII